MKLREVQFTVNHMTCTYINMTWDHTQTVRNEGKYMLMHGNTQRTIRNYSDYVKNIQGNANKQNIDRLEEMSNLHTHTHTDTHILTQTGTLRGQPI